MTENFKAGQECWLVRLDGEGLYCVVVGKFVEYHNGKRYVQTTIDMPDGSIDTLVVNRPPEEVYAKERRALVVASEKAQSAGKKNYERAFSLMLEAATLAKDEDLEEALLKLGRKHGGRA